MPILAAVAVVRLLLLLAEIVREYALTDLTLVHLPLVAVRDTGLLQASRERRQEVLITLACLAILHHELLWSELLAHNVLLPAILLLLLLLERHHVLLLYLHELFRREASLLLLLLICG